jgi:hypothetical protein
VIDPGGLEGFFMVEREAGSIWRYYSLTRVHLLIPDAMAPPSKRPFEQGGCAVSLSGWHTD